MSEPDVHEKDSSDEPRITINLSSDKYESSESEEESDEEFPELYIGPGVYHITSANDVNEVIQNVFMVFEDRLLSLANTVMPLTCTSEGCLSRVKLSTECEGSALYIQWKCMNGQIIHSWCSQPLLNKRLHAGDLLSATSILLSGNDYQKIAHFVKILGLPFVCAIIFSKIQKTYIIPAVDSGKEKLEEKNLLLENEKLQKEIEKMKDERQLIVTNKSY